MSLPILPAVPATWPRTSTSSTMPSLMARDGTGMVPSPRWLATRRSTSRPAGPNDANVPTAPPMSTRKSRSSRRSSRSVCAVSSSIQTATLKPNVTGTACWLCVRPAIGTAADASACLDMPRSTLASRSLTARCASRSTSTSAVWVMFCVVAPQCTQPPYSRPTTRANSSMSGISGWLADAVSAATRSRSSFSIWAARAIVSPAGSGIRPTSASASASAASTSRRAWNRFSTLKRCAIPASGTRPSVKCRIDSPFIPGNPTQFLCRT